MPAPTLRTTFSHVSEFFAMSVTSSSSSRRLPDLVRWLWHPTQYRLMSAFCGGTVAPATCPNAANADATGCDDERLPCWSSAPTYTEAQAAIIPPARTL